MAKIPTVAIANGDGSDFIIINQSDYDDELHTLWERQTSDAYAFTQEPEPSFHDYPAGDLDESEPLAVVDQTEADPIAARADKLAEAHTMIELKAMAKDLSIAGYSKMNQADITVAIAQAEADGDD